MKKVLPYILLILVVIGLVLMEFLGPKPVDWSPGYDQDNKSPFGGYLVYEMMGDLFPAERITEVDDSPRLFLPAVQPSRSNAPKTNYIIITEEFEPDQYETKAILDYVAAGNRAFIAADYFKGIFADSLDILSRKLDAEMIERMLTEEEVLKLDEDTFGENDRWPLLKRVIYNTFRNTNEGEVLGKNQDRMPNFYSLKHGKGTFYLHSVPLVFSNFYMMDGKTHSYISKALSVLPAGETYWDEYFKPHRVRLNTPLKYLLEQKSLYWAWIITLISVLLFLMFETKRRQRVIPVIEPPKNASLEFTQVVGRLFQQYGDHENIVLKKYKYLFEYVRNRFQLNVVGTDREVYISRLAARSGVAETLVRSLMEEYDRSKQNVGLGEEDLLRINARMEEFYEKSK